jgi:hypothetical protein
MFSVFGRRVGGSGVVAVVALVFALSGGAYAAGRYVVTSTKQISPKVLKALKGANGKNGVAGAPGAAGPAGPAGPAGGKGETGAAGSAGGAGKEGPKGVEGPEGPEGSPWTAGGVLPEGKTETGAWSVQSFSESLALSSVSFAIPLEVALSRWKWRWVLNMCSSLRKKTRKLMKRNVRGT